MIASHILALPERLSNPVPLALPALPARHNKVNPGVIHARMLLKIRKTRMVSTPPQRRGFLRNIFVNPLRIRPVSLAILSFEPLVDSNRFHIPGHDVVTRRVRAVTGTVEVSQHKNGSTGDGCLVRAAVQNQRRCERTLAIRNMVPVGAHNRQNLATGLGDETCSGCAPDTARAGELAGNVRGGREPKGVAFLQRDGRAAVKDCYEFPCGLSIFAANTHIRELREQLGEVSSLADEGLLDRWEVLVPTDEDEVRGTEYVGVVESHFAGYGDAAGRPGDLGEAGVV